MTVRQNWGSLTGGSHAGCGPSRRATDKQAVHAAVTLPHHNGGTEGVNTKTKPIMRQMLGRASSALVRLRILLGVI